MRTELEKIKDQIYEDAHKPFVTARFGDRWKEHQKKLLEEGQIDIDGLLDIAWINGRQNILWERYFEEKNKLQ